MHCILIQNAAGQASGNEEAGWSGRNFRGWNWPLTPLATGVATPFGPVLGEEEFMGLGFAPDGTLYGVNAGSGTAAAGSLYRFDPVPGAATKVGVTGGCFDIMDLAWTPDGTMYGAVDDSLCRVNPTTDEGGSTAPTVVATDTRWPSKRSRRPGSSG